jgi:uncharacterized protein YmfQ (DUF2313 family)
MIFSLNEHTRALADYLPNGRTFEAKGIGGSNLWQLLEGLSGELKRTQEYISTLEDEFIPDQTTLFLSEWEKALGIPDTCFTGSGTDEERRRDILTKLASLGVQTVEDFERLALVFGVTVDVLSGVDSGLSFDDITTARYTIVANIEVPERFIYTFPFTFGSQLTALLQCIFERVIPENCRVIFQEI